MISYENECCNCSVDGFPCIGDSCKNIDVKHYYCDDCKDEFDIIYDFDGRELCIDCIEKTLKRVE